ncbi:hypothetical protein Tco_0710076 [Tanacetum coccineum]
MAPRSNRKDQRAQMVKMKEKILGLGLVLLLPWFFLLVPSANGTSWDCHGVLSSSGGEMKEKVLGLGLVLLLPWFFVLVPSASGTSWDYHGVLSSSRGEVPKFWIDMEPHSYSSPFNNEAIIEGQLIARVESRLEDKREEMRAEMRNV